MLYLFVGIMVMTVFGYSFANPIGHDDVTNDYITVTYYPGECGAFNTQTFTNVPSEGPIPEFDTTRLESEGYGRCLHWDRSYVPCSREYLSHCRLCEFREWYRISPPSSPDIVYVPWWNELCYNFEGIEIRADIQIDIFNCSLGFSGRFFASGIPADSVNISPERTEDGYIFYHESELFLYPNEVYFNIILPSENFRGTYTVFHDNINGIVAVTVYDDYEYCNSQGEDDDGPYLGMSPGPTYPELGSPGQTTPEAEVPDETPDEIITEEDSTLGNILSNIPDTLANIPIIIYLISGVLIALGIIIFIKSSKKVKN